MLTAYKFRLYPNKEQIETSSNYFGCSRFFGYLKYKVVKQGPYTPGKLKLSI
jgi:transposase